MNWDTDATKSSFETNTTLSGYKEGRGERSTSQHNLGDYGVSYHMQGRELPPILTGYNLVGIKATEVNNMRDAIRDYVARVQSKLDETLQTNDQEFNKAVRGSEVRKAVNEYIDKVKVYCQNIVSGLLVFSDKLADVGNAWITATQNMSSTVKTSTGSFSEGTAYTESVQYNGTTSTGSGVTPTPHGGAGAVVTDQLTF